MRIESDDDASHGFAAIARADARILILGSLPGRRSLSDSQYYAHPQNAFWSIVNDVFAIEGEYEQRCAQLMDAKIALWDVLAESVRPGSLDSDIQTNTSQANDFKTFFEEHRQIERVLFNGQKAAQLFGKFVPPCWAETVLSFDVMPSTSPAYASMSVLEKTSVWRQAIA